MHGYLAILFSFFSFFSFFDTNPSDEGETGSTLLLSDFDTFFIFYRKESEKKGTMEHKGMQEKGYI
jgi:hypothetical protein